MSALIRQSERERGGDGGREIYLYIWTMDKDAREMVGAKWIGGREVNTLAGRAAVVARQEVAGDAARALRRETEVEAERARREARVACLRSRVRVVALRLGAEGDAGPLQVRADQYLQEVEHRAQLARDAVVRDALVAGHAVRIARLADAGRNRREGVSISAIGTVRSHPT